MEDLRFASPLNEKQLLKYLAGTNPRELVDSLTQLIRSGRIAPGTRLPTVRQFTEVLGISAGTVAAVWSRLREAGLVSTHRRGGTTVTEPDIHAAGSTAASPSWAAIDLAQGLPDPALQPALDSALLAGLRSPHVNQSQPEHITDQLRSAVAPTWPFQPRAWVATGGGNECLMLALEAVAPRGGTIAIENPTSPRILEMLQVLGINVLGVACDDEGPVPTALREALAQRPAAFIYQTRAHVPLGHRVEERRLRELAEVLQAGPAETWVLEEDNTGPIAQAEATSMGQLLPDRVLHVRAYCKAYGFDLRTAVAGGPQLLIDRMISLRSHQFGTNSRILQNALAWLITNPGAQAMIGQARQRYAARRDMLVRALAERGITVRARDGLILWIPVPDENQMLVNLATYGVILGAGRACYVSPSPPGHLRISVSRLPDDPERIEELAQIIALSHQGRRRQELE